MYKWKYTLWISKRKYEGCAFVRKTRVEKLDNEEYLPNKDGGTSPKNQVHEELLYPNFVSFLCYQCNINPNNPFLVKHENEIRLLEKEGDNIWGENVREELN